MLRRFGFVTSMCGLAFVIMPMIRVLPRPDFVTFAVGAGLLVLGIFVAIESAARQRSK